MHAGLVEPIMAVVTALANSARSEEGAERTGLVRLASAVAAVVAAAYATGMGPLAPVLAVPVVAWGARRLGPRSLRLGAAWAAGATAAGQLALAVGLAPSVVDDAAAHVSALVAVVAMVGALEAVRAIVLDQNQAAEAAEALLALARSIAPPAMGREAASRVASTVCRIVPVPRAAVLLRERGDGRFTVAGTCGFSEAEATALAARVAGPAAATLAGLVAGPELRPAPPELLGGGRGRSAYVVPVVVRGSVAGFLVADRADRLRSADFPPPMVERLAGVADQAALAFEGSILAEQERAVTERLREADRLKDEFLAMVTHELKTPLAVVTGAARTLQWRGKDLDPAMHEALVESMLRRSEQLNRLVEDLLQASGDVSLDLGPADVAAVARMAVADLATLDPASDVVYQGPVEAPVVADANRLRQVVDNLLSNAVRHAPGSQVTVRLLEAGGVVTVEVTDRGPGLSEDDRERAFQPFFQADTSARREQGGLGLGLHICRRIVEAHGGRIWMEAGEPSGLRVRFTVPVGGPGSRPA